MKYRAKLEYANILRIFIDGKLKKLVRHFAFDLHAVKANVI